LAKNVLIIEDEVFISMVIEQALENLGHNVLDVVRFGEDVMEELDSLDELPDLITCDIHLAGDQTGVETVREINGKYADMPVIYITAYSDEKTIDEINTTNYSGVIYKPFQPDQLKAEIDKIFA